MPALRYSHTCSANFHGQKKGIHFLSNLPALLPTSLHYGQNQWTFFADEILLKLPVPLSILKTTTLNYRDIRMLELALCLQFAKWKCL